MPTQSDKVLKGLIFSFSIYKAIRKVLFFLGILDQRSFKGFILNATEFFQILDKFSFKTNSKLS